MDAAAAHDRDPRLERLVWLLVAALCFFLYGMRGFTYFDEPRYVGIAKETAESGSWLLPRLYGAPYTEKPPLWYWAVGAAGRAFGWNSYAAFLPNVVAHFLTAVLVFDLGRRTTSRRAGLIAALAYASCPLVLRNARSAQIDLLLVFGQALTAWGSILALRSRRFAFGLVAAVGFGVASMVKGHIALFGLLAPLAWCTAHRDWSFLRRPWWIVLAVLGLAPLLAWLWALSDRVGFDEVVRLYWTRQVVERTGGGVAHYAPWPIGKEYLAALVTMLPLVLFVPGAIRDHARSRAVRAFLLWAGAFFVVFALVPSKREIYLLPLALPLALAVGTRLAAFDAGDRAPSRLESTACLVLVPLLVLAGLALPVYAFLRGGLGVEAFLAAAIAVVAGFGAWRVARARLPQAPLRTFLLLAAITVFAEPAFSRIANARFGEREFGLAAKSHVPEGDPVFVLSITKAQVLRYYGERDLVFVPGPEQIAAALGDRKRAFVVTRGRDPQRLQELGFTIEELAVEPHETAARAWRLLAIRR